MRTTILALVMLLAPLASAQTEAELEDLFSCLEEIESSKRLSCYDAAVVDLHAERRAVVSSLGDTEEPPLAATENTEANNTQSAVSSSSSSAEVITPGRIMRSVTNVRRESGKVIVTLDNGQIWRQTDNTNLYRSLRNTIEQAEIKRGRFGGTWIKLDGGRGFRAQRIR